jgi:cyclophilin family peptidyl-prolyl cis-trans isomerase
MWDRIRIGRAQPGRPGDGAASRVGRRSGRRPLVESLEERRLLATSPTASLAPITNLTVPAQQGYTVPLNGSANTNAQTYTVTSSNPDIPASIISGPFWTVNVQYTDPTNHQNDFSGPLTFQLFNSAGSTTLASTTVSRIEQFTNDGYYTNTGKYITRVATGFPGATDYVVQGGAPNPNGTGNSGQPNTPFANQNFQQLAFTGTNQLAMANAGGTNSNDTQFFITTGSPNSELGYNYTIFGQLVSGQNTLAQLTKIPVTTNPNLGNEDSLPVNSPIFSAVTLSNSNPNGVALIDTTQAKAGETSTITVTATDPTNGTTSTQSFTVTVGPYAGPTSPSINFAPFANPTTATAPQGQSTQITLSGSSGYPNSSVTPTLTYALVSQPAHGTITNFNPSTGTLTYTPMTGYTGTDTFNFRVSQAPPTSSTVTVNNGPNGAPVTTMSNPGTVTITVSPAQPVSTGAVRVVGPVLIVTPLPHGNHKPNIIDVVQTPSTSTSSTPVIQVFVNGRLDINQPQVSTIDSIIVFGSKARDRITIDPAVTIPSVIDGGHGGRNTLVGGGAETREHGWFGSNTMVGGNGPNQLIGRAGHVKFKPSSATTLIFAGTPGRPGNPPGGTFYVYKNGRLTPVPVSNLFPHATTTGTSTHGTKKHSGTITHPKKK